jgi:hypothetical protein
MKTTILLTLGLLGLGVSRASAQLVVTAPVLEVQGGVQTGLQGTMKALSAAANKLVASGVSEQQLTKIFSEKNLKLAQTWYDGLQQISSAVRDYRRVRSIFEKQGRIISTYSTAIETLRKSPHITPGQLSTMTTVYGKMLLESSNTLDDLRTVVSPATFKMTDAERLRFIDQLDTKITKQYELVDYYTRRNLYQLRLAQQKVQDEKSVLALMGAK